MNLKQLRLSTLAAVLVAGTASAQKTVTTGTGNGGSPHVKSTWTVSGATISVEYGRPSLKGLVGERTAREPSHRVPGLDAARRDRLRGDHRRPRATDHPVRRRPSSRPIPISTSTDRSRFRRTRRPSISRSPIASGTLDLWAAPVRRRPRAPADVVLARHLCADRLRRRQRALQGPELSHRRRARRGVRWTEPAARDVSKRNAVVGSDRPAARHHLRHVAPGRGRCALSRHRAGRRHHRGGSGESRGAAVERRARVGVGGPGALLVAQRQVDRVSLAQGSVRRRLAAACGRRRRRRAASVFWGAAPRSAGRAGRRTADWLLFDGASKSSHRSVMFVAGRRSGDRRGDPRSRSSSPLGGVDAEVSHAEWLPDSAHIVGDQQGRPGPARHRHAGARRRRRARRASLRVRARRARPRRSRQTAATSRSSRRRRTDSFRCSGCRSPAARRAGDHRSDEQDAAGLVARRPAARVHGVELRRAVLEDAMSHDDVLARPSGAARGIDVSRP